MIELVVVMVLIGIMAAIAIPRMGNVNEFRAMAFRDSVVSGLRFAQKTATSRRHVVCAAITGTTLTLTIAAGGGVGAACDTDLPLSDGAAAVNSPDPANVTLAGMPAALFFQPDGRITTNAAGTANASVTDASVGGQTIALEGSTGYVQ